MLRSFKRLCWGFPMWIDRTGAHNMFVNEEWGWTTRVNVLHRSTQLFVSSCPHNLAFLCGCFSLKWLTNFSPPHAFNWLLIPPTIRTRWPCTYIVWRCVEERVWLCVRSQETLITGGTRPKWPTRACPSLPDSFGVGTALVRQARPWTQIWARGVE